MFVFWGHADPSRRDASRSARTSACPKMHHLRGSFCRRLFCAFRLISATAVIGAVAIVRHITHGNLADEVAAKELVVTGVRALAVDATELNVRADTVYIVGTQRAVLAERTRSPTIQPINARCG